MGDPFLTWIGLASGGGIFTALMVALFRGWIWVKPSVDELKARHAEAIATRDEQITYWRDAYQRADERNDELTDHIGEMVQVARTSNAVLTALPRHASP